MENVEFIEEQRNQREPRPTFLSVLCVLSFTSLGLALFSGLFGFISGPVGEEEMLKQKVELTKAADELRSLDMEGFATMMEKIQRMTETLNDHFYISNVISLLFAAIGLLGVIQMWMGKKMGFQLYMAYSLLSVIQMYFFVDPADIPLFVVVWNVILSALFIFLYSRNLKWMA